MLAFRLCQAFVFNRIKGASKGVHRNVLAVLVSEYNTGWEISRDSPVLAGHCAIALQSSKRNHQRRSDMAKRTASAVWEGTLREGKGTIKLGSGAFEGQYSFSSRFEEGTGTNPEELVGAAHAGCFSMALAAGLTKAGHNPKRISTNANVSLEKVGEGFKITTIELITEGEVPGIDEQTFLEAAESAKKNCPVSQALAGVDIKLNATFVKSAAA
jgi:osmotically inducible protein OsmC